MKLLPLQWLFFLVTFVLGGCASHKPVWTSDQQRAKSFQAFRGVSFSGESAGVFMKQRTAVLVSGITSFVTDSGHHNLTLEFAREPNRSVHCGQAIAIEPDGYFLTAAHCLDHPVNYLVYSDGQRARAGIPRIVAQVFDPSKHLDVAIIYMNVAVPHYFTWADEGEFQQGDEITELGSSTVSQLSANRGLLKRACMAGQVEAVRSAASGARIVLSDLPTREGDSGGPVISRSGRLVGIHSGVVTSWLGKARAVAVRPNPSWVASVVDRDRLTTTPELPELQVSAQASPSEPGIVVSFE